MYNALVWTEFVAQHWGKWQVGFVNTGTKHLGVIKGAKLFIV
jgi:hypothetical protein